MRIRKEVLGSESYCRKVHMPFQDRGHLAGEAFLLPRAPPHSSILSCTKCATPGPFWCPTQKSFRSFKSRSQHMYTYICQTLQGCTLFLRIKSKILNQPTGSSRTWTLLHRSLVHRHSPHCRHDAPAPQAPASSRGTAHTVVKRLDTGAGLRGPNLPSCLLAVRIWVT